MSEVWLHPNRRVLLLAIVPVTILGGVGTAIIWSEVLPLPHWLGVGCLGLAGVFLVGLLRQLLQPRIAYRDGTVLFYLKAGGPIVTPLHVVEGFFQGEGIAVLPGNSEKQTKVANLIARLAQREADWQDHDVKAALGDWTKGYVTVRGTWCEPITSDVIRRLNRRLSEATRACQAESGETRQGQDATQA